MIDSIKWLMVYTRIGHNSEHEPCGQERFLNCDTCVMIYIVVMV